MKSRLILTFLISSCVNSSCNACTSISNSCSCITNRKFVFMESHCNLLALPIKCSGLLCLKLPYWACLLQELTLEISLMGLCV